MSKKKNPSGVPGSKTASINFTKDGGEVESLGPLIKTLDELLAAAKVDLTRWRVEEHRVNAYQTQSADGPIQLYQVKASLKPRKVESDLSGLMNEFVARAQEKAPKFKFPPLPKVTGEYLLEISVPDVHLAKLCWGKETGHSNYDIKIAAELYRRTVLDLYNRSRGQVARVLFPIGNDFFNSDNINGTTTKGTPQATSEDTRWPNMFATGCDMLTSVIEQICSEVPVDILVVAGNHDKERSFYLGEYLKAWFHNTDRVTVNSDPIQRKYYRFGNTLIGFTHGSEEKPDKLPLLMANEQKVAWAETKFRQWHVGHLHHEITKDIQGVVVRFLMSICPPDEWHASKGYVGSVQGAEAFLYDYERGLVSVFYSNV